MKSGSIIAIALFAMIWLFGGLTYSAINPAKSIGTAIAMLFSSINDHTEPIIQLWLFIIIPVLGAVAGTFVYMVTQSDEFDLNKYLSSIKKKKSEEGADEEFTEESEELSSEESSEETADEISEDIPEIESEEEEIVVETKTE